MFRVPTYQVISFLNWIKEHSLINEDLTKIEEIRQLAFSFIYSKSKLEPLRKLMIEFQITKYPYTDPIDAMKCFLTQYSNSQIVAEEDYIKRYDLHPLLERFLCFAVEKGVSQRIRQYNSDVCNLEQTVVIYKRDILMCFIRYISNHAYKRDINSFNEAKFYSNRRNFFDTQTVTFNPEDIEQEVERLIQSVLHLLNQGKLNSYFQTDNSVSNFLLTISNIPKNFVQSLEFLSWLKQKHSILIINGNIPSDKMDSFLTLFCDEKGYENKNSLKRDLKKIFQGEIQSNFITRFFNSVSSRSSRQQLTLNKYFNTSFHGVFLYDSPEGFQKFINDYWVKLNGLTGKFMNIYYSQQDFNERISTFETIDGFSTIDVDFTKIPALLLWDNSLANAETISIKSLNHEQIYDLIKVVVQNIKLGKPFLDIIELTSNWVTEETSNKQGTNLIQNEGVLIMGDNYINNGQTVVLGPNAKVYKNTITQGETNKEKGYIMSEDDIYLLQKMITLLGHNDGTDNSTKLSAALQLAHILDAVNDKNQMKQEEAVANWHSWFKNLTNDKGKIILGVIADVITVSSTLAPYLGFK